MLILKVMGCKIKLGNFLNISGLAIMCHDSHFGKLSQSLIQ